MEISSTPDSFDVSWEEPAITHPCTISGYDVSSRLTELDQCEPQNGPWKSVDTTMTETTISELASHSSYEISVRAYSGTVFGESDIRSAKTDEDGECVYYKKSTE